LTDVSTVLDRRPGYLPPGYTERYRLPGGREPGFGWIEQQVVLVYTTGWSRLDFSSPLVVVVGRDGAPDLVGTSPGHAEPLDLGVPGVVAAYHDGILAARLDEMRDFAGTTWKRGDVHSITARSASGTFAVRGPRSLPRSELIATLLSLSPGG
jgi:hypothetical protein